MDFIIKMGTVLGYVGAVGVLSKISPGLLMVAVSLPMVFLLGLLVWAFLNDAPNGASSGSWSPRDIDARD